MLRLGNVVLGGCVLREVDLAKILQTGVAGENVLLMATLLPQVEVRAV